MYIISLKRIQIIRVFPRTKNSVTHGPCVIIFYSKEENKPNFLELHIINIIRNGTIHRLSQHNFVLFQTHPPTMSALNISKTGHFQTHPPSHLDDVMNGWSPVVQCQIFMLISFLIPRILIISTHDGNTGCEVFKEEIQNSNKFFFIV